MASTVGVVVGRFQTDALTPGHRGLLQHAADNSSKLIVFIGLCPTPLNSRDPLPYDAVEMMVRDFVPNATILPIMDVGPGELANKQWSKNLDTAITTIAGMRPVTLFTGRDGFKRHYRGKFPVEEISVDCDKVNATAIRQKIASEIVNSRMWRKGVIWAMQNKQFHSYYAVDMAGLRITMDQRVEILLARRPNQEQWRFPGGFVEPGESFTQAAGREFFEETDLYTGDGFRLVQDFVIDDWRTRYKPGVETKTMLCVGWVTHGIPVAKDDLEGGDVKWFDIVHVKHNLDKLVIENHRKLFPAVWKHLTDSGIPPEVVKRVIQGY